MAGESEEEASHNSHAARTIIAFDEDKTVTSGAGQGTFVIGALVENEGDVNGNSPGAKDRSEDAITIATSDTFVIMDGESMNVDGSFLEESCASRGRNLDQPRSTSSPSSTSIPDDLIMQERILSEEDFEELRSIGSQSFGSFILSDFGTPNMDYGWGDSRRSSDRRISDVREGSWLDLDMEDQDLDEAEDDKPYPSSLKPQTGTHLAPPKPHRGRHLNLPKSDCSPPSSKEMPVPFLGPKPVCSNLDTFLDNEYSGTACETESTGSCLSADETYELGSSNLTHHYGQGLVLDKLTNIPSSETSALKPAPAKALKLRVKQRVMSAPTQVERQPDMEHGYGYGLPFANKFSFM